MQKITIKQQLLEYLNSDFSLCYGLADRLTNSQSGSRRLRELIAESPSKYRFVKVKSDHGAYYNYFGKPSSFKIIGWKGQWDLVASSPRIGKRLGVYKSKQEAQAQIRKVVR